MDKIAEIKSREILEVIGPSALVFKEVFDKIGRSVITDVPTKTFKYGPTDRHQLDIYFPITPNEKTPILFFIYGGGFVDGARKLPAPFDYIYPNLGAYFARQGFIVVIADYRLVPSVIYPEPAEDIRDAIVWILKNSNELVTPTTPNPDLDSLFIIGNSAGGTHAATIVFDPAVLAPYPEIRPKIKGLILMSGLHHFELHTGFEDTAEIYWGSVEKYTSHSPLRLLKASKSNGITLPKVLLVEAERDPQVLFDIRVAFEEALNSILGSPVKRILAEGHNHISICTALSSGEGEQWAAETSDWIRSVL